LLVRRRGNLRLLPAGVGGGGLPGGRLALRGPGHRNRLPAGGLSPPFPETRILFGASPEDEHPVRKTGAECGEGCGKPDRAGHPAVGGGAVRRPPAPVCQRFTLRLWSSGSPGAGSRIPGSGGGLLAAPNTHRLRRITGGRGRTPPGPLRNRYEALPSRWHNHSCPPQRGKGAEEPEPEAEKEGRPYQEKPRKTADLAGPGGPDKVGDTTKRKAPPLAEEQPARRNRAGSLYQMSGCFLRTQQRVFNTLCAIVCFGPDGHTLQ